MKKETTMENEKNNENTTKKETIKVRRQKHGKNKSRTGKTEMTRKKNTNMKKTMDKTKRNVKSRAEQHQLKEEGEKAAPPKRTPPLPPSLPLHDPTTRWVLRKQNHKKKAPPPQQKKGAKAEFNPSSMSHILKGNDQCELPGRNCWVSARCVCGKSFLLFFCR